MKRDGIGSGQREVVLRRGGRASLTGGIARAPRCTAHVPARSQPRQGRRKGWGRGLILTYQRDLLSEVRFFKLDTIICRMRSISKWQEEEQSKIHL